MDTAEYQREWRKENPNYHKEYYKAKKENPDLFPIKEKDPALRRLARLNRNVAISKAEKQLAREEKLKLRKEAQALYSKEWRKKNPNYWKEYFKKNPDQKRKRKVRKRGRVRRIYYEGYSNPQGELQWLRTIEAQLRNLRRHLKKLEASRSQSLELRTLDSSPR
jgi:hypothetical protein